MKKKTLFIIGLLIGFGTGIIFTPLIFIDPEIEKLEKQKTQLEIEYLQIQLYNYKSEKHHK